MSYDPDRPMLPRSDDDSVRPWLPPPISRGPINPPELYRKTKAHVAYRDVHKTRLMRRTVPVPVAVPVLTARPPVLGPIGERWQTPSVCPACRAHVNEVVRVLPTHNLRAPMWVCLDCAPPRIRRIGAHDFWKEWCR